MIAQSGDRRTVIHKLTGSIPRRTVHFRGFVRIKQLIIACSVPSTAFIIGNYNALRYDELLAMYFYWIVTTFHFTIIWENFILIIYVIRTYMESEISILKCKGQKVDLFMHSLVGQLNRLFTIYICWTWD